jgi:hypothetical protein
MVIDTASRLLSFLEEFDSTKKKHHQLLKEIVKQYPIFHLVKPYFLKSVEQNEPENYDAVLSHTSIATLDRKVLYEFLENQQYTTEKQPPEENVKVKTSQEKEKKVQKKNPTIQSEKQNNEYPSELSFSEWASYLKANRQSRKSNQIDEKLELIDTFLQKKRTVVPTKGILNNDDLSSQSLAPTDELMTETLAKVFVKQKKFEEATQAYQILSLKYPEKNSFFADQIKEIKRLQKLKE